MTDQGGVPAPPPDLTVPPAILAPALAFAGGRVILAPFQVLLTGADQIRVLINNIVAGATVLVSGLVRRDDGTLEPFSASYLPASDGTQSTFFLPIGPGFLLFLSATAPGGSAFEGATYIAVQIVRGASTTPTLLTTLIQGYVSSTSFRSWPGSPVQGPQEGPGQLVTQTLPNPAAGVDWSLQVPTNQLWRLVAMRGQLVTSAGVGQRVPILQMATGGNNFVFVPHTLALAPSMSAQYSWMVGGAYANPWSAQADRVLGGTKPAAGADWTFTVPGGHILELVSLFAQLQTSAAAGNRKPNVRLTGGGGLFAQLPMQTILGPSNTYNLCWAQGGTTPTNLGPVELLAGLPTGVRLWPGDIVAVATDGLDAADQWLAPAFRVREASGSIASSCAPLPDGLDLPAGSVIQGATDNLEAGDQWQQLVATVVKHVIP